MQRSGHEMLGRSCGSTYLEAKDYSGSLPDCRAWPKYTAGTPAYLKAERAHQCTGWMHASKGNSRGPPDVVSQQGEGAAWLRLGRGPPCHPGLMQLPEQVVACRQA